MKNVCNCCHDTGLMGGYQDSYSTPCDACDGPEKTSGIALYVIAALVIVSVVALVGRIPA